MSEKLAVRHAVVCCSVPSILRATIHSRFFHAQDRQADLAEWVPGGLGALPAETGKISPEKREKGEGPIGPPHAGTGRPAALGVPQFGPPSVRH